MYSSLDHSLELTRREETRREVGRNRLAERLRTSREDRAVRRPFRLIRNLRSTKRGVGPESV